MPLNGKEVENISFTNTLHCFSRCSYSYLLATVARHQLDKNGGHSSQEDRQKLFTQAYERYQLSGKISLADREFIGQRWLSFLVDKKIDFIIRMSKNCYKLPISEAPGFVHSKLKKNALKAKNLIKVFLNYFK